MKENIEEIRKVTVIGLGQMGATLAELLLKNDYQVTVWNRTRSRADFLVKQGAMFAGDIVSAVKASPITVICVFDYNVSKELLDTTAVTSGLAGKILIQVTTGSPNEAIESETWANKHGALYIDGAIQVAPDQMAKPDTTIFISGSEKAYGQSERILKVFGGNIRYLGKKISAASAMDLASLSYLYGSMLGFFHAVRICEMEGFRIDLLGEIIKEISPGFASFLQYESGVIQTGNFAITQSPLSISVEATERILKSSQEYKINTEVPKLASEFLKRAKLAGYEKEELASLIKVFR